jgi:hypothetical protein
MIDNKVLEPMKISQSPPNAKLLSTTWAMKKRHMVNTEQKLQPQGFLQEVGINYFSHSTAAPVANKLTF